MPTLYDELGVSRDASSHQLRRAYRARARQLHPDVNPDPEAQQAIRRLNEVWAVLGNPEGRRRYDASLCESEPTLITTGRLQPSQPVQSPLAWILRPSVIVLAVLGLIFLVTAYAGPHSSQHGPPASSPASSVTRSTSTAPTTAAVSSLVGKCLLIQPGYDAITSCNQPNNGQVVAEVAQVSQCPPGSVGYQLTGRAQLVCLSTPR